MGCWKGGFNTQTIATLLIRNKTQYYVKMIFLIGWAILQFLLVPPADSRSIHTAEATEDGYGIMV